MTKKRVWWRKSTRILDGEKLQYALDKRIIVQKMIVAPLPAEG